MLELIGSIKNFQALPIEKLWEKDDDQVLAYKRGKLIFVFNFSPSKSYTDYGILAPQGEYKVVLDSDRKEFAGYGNIDDKVHHITDYDPLYDPHNLGWLKLYLPARSAQILKIL